MAPWVEIPSITVGAWTVEPYPVFLAAGVLVGRFAFVKAATARGVNAEMAKALYAIILVAAALAGPVWMFFREPALLRTDPRVWPGFVMASSSWTGIAAGVSAALALTWKARLSRRQCWRLCDSFAWAFPFGWLVLRLGCAWTHHHPGISSTSPLAVRFPGGSRYDLALLEALLCLALILWWAALRRRQLGEGIVSGIVLIAVGAFRYGATGLRLDSSAGTSVGDWIGVTALVAVGAVATAYGLRRRSGRERPSELERAIA